MLASCYAYAGLQPEVTFDAGMQVLLKQKWSTSPGFGERRREMMTAFHGENREAPTGGRVRWDFPLGVRAQAIAPQPPFSATTAQ